MFKFGSISFAVLALIFGSAFTPVTAAGTITVSVQDAGGQVLASKSDPQNAALDFNAVYPPGARLVFTSPSKYLFIQIDPAIPESLVYLPSGQFTFPIPEGKDRVDYAPNVFESAQHSIKAHLATAADLAADRNVALNALDKRGSSGSFPHATANFVTREDPEFYERNAIDGNTDNVHHGAWPYESWAGGKREDLTFKLDFGRPVEIDKLRFFIRCDFPHDSYWKSLVVHFSDGTQQDVTFKPTRDGQEVSFPKKTVTWLSLDGFKQVSQPLNWAALTEIEVYGHDLSTAQP